MLQVTATDVDVNDTLTYTLATGSQDFTIDGNGQIRARNTFDREVWKKAYIAARVLHLRYAGYLQLPVCG